MTTGEAGRAPRLRLLSRSGCHLCDAAREVLARVAADTGTRWDECDVDDDPLLVEAYGDRVPVVLLDGQEHGYWRIEELRLRAALAGRRTWTLR